MAMSDTGSSFAQWAALYHHHHNDAAGPVLPDDDAAADVGVTAAAAAAAAVASPTSGGSSGGSPTKAGAHQLQLHGVEGPRIGKPAARRRSRASRRAPVTLLNTDTANFRAMVQQFTGIPAPPAGAFGAPVISFAADYGFPPSSAAVMSFDHHQLHRSQHTAPLQEQLRRQQQQQQQYTGAAPPFGYSNDGGDVFAPASASASHGFAAAAEERMLLQSIQAAQMPHMPPVSAANTGTNGFFA